MKPSFRPVSCLAVEPWTTLASSEEIPPPAESSSTSHRAAQSPRGEGPRSAWRWARNGFIRKAPGTMRPVLRREEYSCYTGSAGNPSSRLNGKHCVEIRPRPGSASSSPEVFKTNFPLLCKIGKYQGASTAQRNSATVPPTGVRRHLEE